MRHFNKRIFYRGSYILRLNSKLTMEEVAQFLESSSINGLYFISTTRRWSRLFWIFIVLIGFSGAAIIINDLNYNWGQSPVVTVTETMPLRNVTFPNVTVCPPKSSVLNLNYDLIKSEKQNISQHARKELFQFVLEVIQKDFYEEIMTNLSRILIQDGYSNWYYGYTKVEYPKYGMKGSIWNFPNIYYYKVTTSSTSGNISTKYFGEKFHPEKIDGDLFLHVSINFPDKNDTLMINLEKITIKDKKVKDYIRINFEGYDDDDSTHISKNITYAELNERTKDEVYFTLFRQVSKQDLLTMDYLDQMPGFRLEWKFKSHKTSYPVFSDDKITNEFRR